MNLRTYMFLALFTVTLLAWTFIHYQFEESVQHRLKQLSNTPVFVYNSDPEKLESLLRDLRNGVPQIDSLNVLSGLSAAKQMIREYQMGIEPTTLEDYLFPDILSIKLKPELASLSAHGKVLEILAKYKVAPEEMEDQQVAWNLFKTDLDYIRDRWSNATIFIALLAFLIFLYARLYLILSETIATKGITATILDALRSKEHRRNQTLVLLFVPMLVNLAVYKVLEAAHLIQPLVGWIFFLVQFSVLLTATIIVSMLDNMRYTTDEHNSTLPLELPGQKDVLGS